PLVNWLVASSFKVFGIRNEWTARLPSALSVLTVAIAFVTVARASLGPSGSVTAALIWLTNIGMIEKGRLIEIEGLYVSLSGLARAISIFRVGSKMFRALSSIFCLGSSCSHSCGLRDFKMNYSGD